jgi:signal peptidase I
VDGNRVVVGRLPGIRLAVPSESETKAAAAPSKRSRFSRVLGRVALNIVFVAMVLSAAVMLGPALLGLHRYVILTGSMTGTYNRGSIVFDREVPVSQLKVGDPITYSPPPGFTSQTRVTHRIWSIHRGVNGERIYKTKGDANKHPDIWNFTLNKAMQDEVLFHIPELGYLFLLLSIREFRLVIVGVPALIIGLVQLRQLWRDAGEAARRQKLAKRGWRALGDSGFTAVLAPLQSAATHQVPARLALHLRPVRARPSDPAGRPAGARRRWAEVELPLVVGRLATGPRDGTPATARPSPVPHGRARPGGSQAARHLRVARIT